MDWQKIFSDPQVIGAVVGSIAAAVIVIIIGWISGFFKWLKNIIFPSPTNAVVPIQDYKAEVEEKVREKVKHDLTKEELTNVRQDLALSQEKIDEITSQLEKEREKSSLEENIKTQLKEYDEKGEFEKAEILVEEELVNKKKMELAEAYFQQAGYAMLQLKYEKAKILYEGAIGLSQTNTLYLNQLACLYGNLGYYDKQKSLLEIAITIELENNQEKNKERLIALYNNIGDALQSLNSHEEAISYYKKVIEIDTDLNGPESYLKTIWYNNLADAESHLGNYKVAEKYFADALNIERNKNGEDTANAARILNNLGTLYWKQTRYKEAKIAYEKSVEIGRKTLNSNVPLLAIWISNLGNAYLIEGKYDLTLKCLDEALNIYKKAYGERHPDIAVVYSGFAVVNEKKGLFEIAKKYYLNAIDIDTEFLGEKHPNTVLLKNNLHLLEERISKQ